MREIFFTSDNHWHHANILRPEYSNRPFASVEEMNEALIANWNRVVGKKDVVYHLGDVAMGNRSLAEAIVNRLNGEIHLCTGNHDTKQILRLERWASVADYREVKVDGQRIILSHYPFETWNKSHYGSIHLHGHEHGNLPGNSQRLDVGVDCWDYAPVNLEQIRARLATLPPFQPAGHRQREL